MIAYNNLVKEVKMNFEEYCKNTKFENTNKVENQVKTQKLSEEELKTKLDNYKDMNSDMLMSELIKETNKQKANGNFNEKTISELSSTLKPMLNDVQKQKLDEILKMLR